MLGHIACLDVDNAELQLHHRTKAINGVEEFGIIQKNVKPTPEMGDEALLFRMAEFPDLLIAHEKIKSGFAKAKLTGFRFVETKDFIGY